MLTSILVLIVFILAIIVFLLYEYQDEVIEGLKALSDFYNSYISSNSSDESASKFKKLGVNVYSTTSKFGYIEFFEFIIFLYIMFRCNPFQVTTKYPVASNMLILIVGFLYINIFFFLKNKTTGGQYTPNGSEQNYLLNILSTVFFFGLFIALPMGWFWLKQNDPLIIIGIDTILKTRKTFVGFVGFVGQRIEYYQELLV